ncbi:hypothetical protein [Pedobacter foliorum]|uniref:hypothetical protein n=1 Tax=Pedobacter foliorum TaxID=2739058 RepID=UPI0015651BBF|nr:hypothetical protein [Pedobacter foliorum]NRF38346.1 hypothetical protein [Pedobacter foliorum]
MKQLPLILAFILTLITACNGQNDAKKLSKGIQNVRKENSPGSVATSANGYYMKCKIDGKDWEATGIMPPNLAGRIMGENNGEFISLPYYDKRNFLALKKRKFGDGHNNVDMNLHDDVLYWGAKSGEMIITKADDKWAEGTFSFIANNSKSAKTMAITNGVFRVSLE